MKKLLFCIVCLLFAVLSHAQTQVQLFVEDFEQVDSAFVADTGSLSPQTGNNKWTINNQYVGQPNYPNTTRQDSVYFGNGTINGAPYSHYLHIYNSASNPVDSNANFDPASASDRFVYTRSGFCTLGLTSVQLVFFYLVEGDTTNVPPTAYGQVYYSISNGPWIATGNPYYYHQTKWRYEQITDTAFANKPNVRFGFRWVNAANTTPKTISFGIDDIQLVGTYDSTVNPVNITVDQLQPNPVCRLNNLFFHWKLSTFLCDATYRIELSNSSGGFSANPTSLGIYNIFYPDTAGFLAVTIPSTVPVGSCYKIRLVRVQPAPEIVGAASACFVVQTCPNTITTLTPVVVTDPDTACVKSAIDIPFYSTGVYNSGNNYVAQLSDSSGSFANPQIINSNPDTKTYDPSLGSMPGSVSGLIPVTPAGCNYYIRIVSTNPVAIGTVYGPFCLKHCDMTTNNTVDIQACINELHGLDTTISVKINQFDTTTHYHSGNQFQVELLNKMNLAIVNIGGIGAVYDSITNTFQLHIPNLAGLLALGIQPGGYYARIVADSSTTAPYDTNGTIIHLTIGAPSAYAPNVLVTDSVACNGGGSGSHGSVQGYIIDPYNPNSQYYWLAPFTPNGANAFLWPGNELLVDFTGAAPNFYTVRVREENFGCFGNYSSPATITIISKPVGKIVGPPKACLGDTVKLSVPFLSATYYTWGTAWGSIIDTSNNQISAVFDSVGRATIYNSALNYCGQGKDTFHLNVVSLVNVNVSPDTISVCAGTPVTLTASTAGINNTLITTFTTTFQYDGAMFNVHARDALTINSFDGNFSTAGGAVKVSIFYKTGGFSGYQNNATAWTFLDSTTITTPSAQGTPTTIAIPVNVAMNAGDTMAFYITSTTGKRVRFANNNSSATAFVASDSILDLYSGPVLTYPFGTGLQNKIWSGDVNYTTQAGLKYRWTTGDTTPTTTVRPNITTTFTVKVKDSTGCGNVGSAKVTVNPTPVAHAGDSSNICLGSSVQVNATAGGTFTWTPTTGLPDSTALNFVLKPDTSVVYVLTVKDPNFSCVGKDSLKIKVNAPATANDSGTLCTEHPAILKLPDVPGGGRYYWNTGDTTQAISVIHTGNFIGYYGQAGDSCVSKVVYNVVAKDCNLNLQVPEAFTPNNDGQNDHFTIFGQNIADYDIKIFNRWGELVYHSTDTGEINDLTKGWDGTHRGQLQNVGTYVYYITAKDTYNNRVEKHGNLTLIR